MRQVLYVSISAKPGDAADLVGILRQSRRNNAADGITGILWSDERRFLHVLEGPRASVALTFARIAVDRRHHSLTVLEDNLIGRAEFGRRAIMHRRASDAPDAYLGQMTRALLKASPAIRKHFFGLLTADAPNLPRGNSRELNSLPPRYGRRRSGRLATAASRPFQV
ncbi:BLUF domain-containing protein [Sphingomonas sp. PB4P5]|uniref:BLUF domain-containing protein n=1 Tax=Parasphingomonas puruogangriensis TaxID=3096155 RepID=UPI003FA7C623